MTSLMFSEQELPGEAVPRARVAQDPPLEHAAVFAKWLQAHIHALDASVLHMQKTDMPDTMLRNARSTRESFKVVMQVVHALIASDSHTGVDGSASA